jgi:hypothetical protein
MPKRVPARVEAKDVGRKERINQMSEDTQRRQWWKRGMRREETRLLEWPSEGARYDLYRSMMIFEHGVPGCEIEEDPGQ